MSTTGLDRDGYAVAKDVLTLSERDTVRASAQRLLDSTITRGRDRGTDGKDGFRGCVGLDPDTFLPLISKPTVLRAVIDALGANVHVLSTHLIALPLIPEGATRSIRTPERAGWHRDMYGVTTDLGQHNTPRLAVKCAFYLTPITSDCGITQVLPSSHTLTEPPPTVGGGRRPGRCDHTRHWPVRRDAVRESHLARRWPQFLRMPAFGGDGPVRLPLARPRGRSRPRVTHRLRDNRRAAATVRHARSRPGWGPREGTWRRAAPPLARTPPRHRGGLTWTTTSSPRPTGCCTPATSPAATRSQPHYAPHLHVIVPGGRGDPTIIAISELLPCQLVHPPESP